jgi:hypothetical protein
MSFDHAMRTEELDFGVELPAQIYRERDDCLAIAELEQAGPDGECPSVDRRRDEYPTSTKRVGGFDTLIPVARPQNLEVEKFCQVVRFHRRSSQPRILVAEPYGSHARPRI